MFLIKGKLITQEKMLVDIIYNLDAEENKDINLDDGVIVEEIIKQPERKKGITHIFFVNPITKEQFFEEMERPLTQEEIAQEQNEKIDLLLQMQMSMQGVI